MTGLTIIGVLTAFCGGFFGAMIGGLLSFVLMGFVLLAGLFIAISSGNTDFITHVAWGPIFGPQVGLLGGAVAAAYAYKRGYYENGKDIAPPLVALKKLDVLTVGGVAGVIGYLIAELLNLVPRIGFHLDTIAASIALVLIAARLIFGSTGMTGLRGTGLKTNYDSYRPTKQYFWLPYQSTWRDVTVIGAVTGALAALITLQFLELFPQAATVVHEFAFAISAISLFGSVIGAQMPVTHHITLPAATAASLVFAATTSATMLPAIAAGIVVGALGAILGNAFARLWLIRGDTLIDPPALTNAVLLTALSVIFH